METLAWISAATTSADELDDTAALELLELAEEASEPDEHPARVSVDKASNAASSAAQILLDQF